VSPHVAHLLIGRPTNHAPAGEPAWITAIFRQPVAAPVFLTKLGFEGDEVAEKDVHGGPDKAALCYSLSHYPIWRDEHILDSSAGGFGENLSIEGQSESTVCIGDTFRIGEAEVQISQPRGPCSTLTRRWNLPTLAKLVRENHRSGWYIRVLREGRIAPGDAIERLARPNPTWTIARTAEVNYSPHRTEQDVRALLSVPELSNAWRHDLTIKLQAAAK